MFKGTGQLKEGEFDRMLEGAGAEGENAFTSRDYTAYVQELPSDKLDLIAKLESDRMVSNTTVEAKEVWSCQTSLFRVSLIGMWLFNSTAKPPPSTAFRDCAARR